MVGFGTGLLIANSLICFSIYEALIFFLHEYLFSFKSKSDQCRYWRTGRYLWVIDFTFLLAGGREICLGFSPGHYFINCHFLTTAVLYMVIGSSHICS